MTISVLSIPMVRRDKMGWLILAEMQCTSVHWPQEIAVEILYSASHEIPQYSVPQPKCPFSQSMWTDGMGHLQSDGFQVIWDVLSDLGSNEPNQCKPNRNTYRQHLPKERDSSLMVKMRIDLRSFGLFWFILGWGLCVEKEFVKFKFLGFLRSKVQSWKCGKKGVWM